MIAQLTNNLTEIRQRIDEAAKKSGRHGDDVLLVGVTKYVDADVARELVRAGCRNLGESRPQTLWQKASALADMDVTWHLIGHLQRNKVKRTLEYAQLIHSVDSLRLIRSIDQTAPATVRVLLEVNVSGESAKHGFAAGDLEQALDAASECKQLKVEGLMCMASLLGTLDDARREFALLRQLKERHAGYAAPNIDLQELSMGMSGDFEVAIEEGATIVRVGSSLFSGI